MGAIIKPSILACDIFNLEAWILQHKNCVIHIDLIDPSCANFLGLDLRILDKLQEHNVTFEIHYMAFWNSLLIEKIASHAQKIFFHHSKISDWETFHNLNSSVKVGIALEVGETPKIDTEEYLIMHVPIGFCSQKFDPKNLELAKMLQNNGKIITADGGINMETIELVKHYDNLVIGSALNQHTINEFYAKL